MPQTSTKTDWAAHGRFYIGALTGAVGLVGTLRTFTTTATGSDISAQQFAFYLGASAIAVYVCAAMAAVPAGLVAAGAERVTGDADGSVATGVAIAVWAVAAIAMLVVLINADALFNYEDTDAIGRTAMAVIGIVAVGGGGWYFWKGHKERPGAGE